MVSTSRTFIFSLVSTFIVVVTASITDGIEDEASRRIPSLDDLKKAQEAGVSYVDRLTQLEEDLLAKGFQAKEGSPMSMMAKFKQPSKEIIALSRKNLGFVETIRILRNDFGFREEEMEKFVWDREFNSGCLSEPQCREPDTYRTIDGSCNHRDELRNLGRAVTGYRRFLKPAYDDGISKPRSRDIAGGILPSPRLISMHAFSDDDVPLGEVTSLLMQFGQFINHDMESTSTYTFPNGAGISCCAANNFPLNPSLLNPHCLPITIPIGDRQLNNTNIRCMNFVRSSTGPNRISCNLTFVSYAEQFNQVSHWLDASTVYGSDIVTMTSLRNASNGMLNTYVDPNGHTLLPIQNRRCGSNSFPFEFPQKELVRQSSELRPSGPRPLPPCVFNAGDSRVNEQPQLTVIHTIWMREHNRIAEILTKLNPTWSRETVFQEARRIVIAEMQHITYSEFLPTLLGNNGKSLNNLLMSLPDKNTFHVKRDSPDTMIVNNDGQPGSFKLNTVTSGPVSNEFAAAAFRMGHSLVQGDVQLIDTDGAVTSYDMASVFNNPDLTSNPFFLDNTIRGLINQNSQTVDNQITDALWLNLFRSSDYRGRPSTSLGILDIVALNIQRGRDHGLPSYNSYRVKCGLPKLVGPIRNMPKSWIRKEASGKFMEDNSFAEEQSEIKPTFPPVKKTTPVFDPWVIRNLDRVYKSVDDIDLFVGGLAEINPRSDSLLGPTFMCIIADNFLKLKYEDRYFYEAGQGTNPNPFKPDQLAEIKKSSMARIFCDNNDGTVSTIQPNAFRVSSDTNPITDCNDKDRIPSLNLDLWRA